MSDDLSFDVKVAIQRAILFHPLFEGTAAEALEIAIAAIKAGDEIRASSPAQEPVTTEPVDPLAELVAGFAKALLAKLRLAEANGRSGWEKSDWESDCQQGLLRHVAKGDPRDVAAYCAFMWHHDWIAIPAPPQPRREWQPIETVPSDGTQVLVCGGYLDGVQMRGADGDWWRMSKKDGNRATPTHWQSLPAPYTGEPK